MAPPWNFENAAHLLRRAGFGATKETIEAAVLAGMSDTIDSLFVPDPVSDDLPFEKPSTIDLQGWWLHRMVTTSAPFLEKLVLFFHDHFATAASKVKKKPWMHQQNRTLRSHALGRFRDLLRAMVRDPALLVFLDNQLNVKKSPNENLARELQELFTTGVVGSNGQPNYTEKDVSECARALTGLTVVKGEFVFDATLHDDGMKTFKSVSAKFDADAVVDLLANDPSTAKRLVKRLWSFFAFPIGSKDPLVAELAGVYLAADTDLRALLKAMFRHDAFYSPAAKAGAVRCPAEFVVVALRGLGATLSDVPSKWGALGKQVAAMGQALFEPPSVFGWPGGNTWVELAGLQQRLVVASSIANHRAKGSSSYSYDPAALLGPEEGFTSLDADAVVTGVLDALGPLIVRPTTRAALVEYALDGAQSLTIDAEFIDRKVRGLIALAMSTAEYQLALGSVEAFS